MASSPPASGRPIAGSAPSRASLAGGLLVAGLFALLFWPTFVNLASLWDKDPNYSHGFLVPPIAAALAVYRLRQVGPPRAGEPLLGALTLLAGCVLHFAALVLAWPPLDFLALALVLRGLAVTTGGREWARPFTFPILFLFFMFPLPAAWASEAALWLQDGVSRASAALLNLFTVCYRRGHTLFLPGVDRPLVVGQECSGLRQVVAFVSLGVFLAHLRGRPWGFRALVVLAAVPVALAANVARILLLVAFASAYGTGWLDTSLHHAPAVFVLPFGLVLYLGVFWALGRVSREEEPWPGVKRSPGGGP